LQPRLARFVRAAAAITYCVIPLFRGRQTHCRSRMINRNALQARLRPCLRNAARQFTARRGVKKSDFAARCKGVRWLYQAPSLAMWDENALWFSPKTTFLT